MELTNSEKQFNRMLNTPIPRLVTAMAVPTVISMMVTVIYNTADTYFVSQINASASAAVGAVYPLMAVIQAVGYGLGMGSGNLVSRVLGQKQDDKAKMFASTAFFLGLGIGALIALVGTVADEPILRLLGCSKTMLPYAVSYARFITLAAPVSCSTFVLSNVLRAEGEAKLSMWGMGIGGLINMVLDPIFIFKLNMGTGGAALATVISQIISFIIFLYAYLSGRSIVKLSVHAVSLKPRDCGQIITTGFPTVARQSLGSLSAALLNNQAVIYGDPAVCAITIANKVYVLVRNVVLGFGQGFQPVAGYNFGAGDRKRTWKAFVFTTWVGTAVCVAATVPVLLWPAGIIRWFNDEAAVLPIGVETLCFAGAVMPLMALSTYVNQMYQCLGFKAKATFLASCRQGIFFVPAILLLPRFFGCTGVEASQPMADFLTFAASVPFLILFYRKEIAPYKGKDNE